MGCGGVDCAVRLLYGNGAGDSWCKHVTGCQTCLTSTGLTSGGVVALSRVGCNYGWFVWDCSRVDDPVDSPPGNNVRSRPSRHADRRTIRTFMSNNPRDNQSRSSNNPQTIFSLLSSTSPQASVTTLLSSDNTQGSKPACGTTHDSHDDLVDSST